MELTHINALGQATMVDIGNKPIAKRFAKAEGYIHFSASTLEQILEGKIPKGEVFSVARIAGIQAAKNCCQLIPLCHHLLLSYIQVTFVPEPKLDIKGKAVLKIEASCQTQYATGVEMEALTAVSVAALTIYDMCKGIDQQIEIANIHLIKKTKSMAEASKTGSIMTKPG